MSKTMTLEQQVRRIPASVFQFDPRIADGHYSDIYFPRAQHTLAHAGLNPVATMQFFAKKHGVVAGIVEAIRMLQTCSRASLGEIEVSALPEGSTVEPWETVMLVRAPYRGTGHLETPMLGVLARRSLVATNTHLVIEAAGGKPVIFMAPRHDDWRVQTPDGYAALIGGIGSVSSDAGGSWWGVQGVGTIPHALIALMGGDINAATLAFTRAMRERDPEIRTVSLVDYNNRCVEDSVSVARAMEAEFGPGALFAVRLDTSEKLVDEALADEAERFGPEAYRGVCPPLVRAVRQALDHHGFGGVGIIVSGGFTPAKIRRFEEDGVPVAGYGVGSSILGHSDASSGLHSGMDFTADVVEVDGKPQAKIGRQLNPNPRLVRLDWGSVL